MENLFEMYKKESFTIQDSKLIDTEIDKGNLSTEDIKENFMDYVYENINDKYTTEDIWKFTDEHYNNGLTHYENYKNLINFLKTF